MLLSESSDETIQIFVELLAWIRMSIASLTQKSPLLAKCGLRARSGYGVLTDLIAADYTESLILAKG